MSRILIVGCGYLGQATADLFHESGWSVEGWTASAKSAATASADKPYPVLACDAAERAVVTARTGDFDAVLQCVSSRGGDAEAYRRVYLQTARNLCEHFPAAAFVFTSSTSVYAQGNGEWVDETSRAEPTRGTAKVLREAEEFVLAHGGVVARLAGIYGPGRAALLKKFLLGEGIGAGDEERFVNYIHRDDAAHALALLIERQISQPTRGQIFNVADDDPLPRRACYEWLAETLHRTVPEASTAASTRKRGDTNKRVSNAKLRALGWKPRFPTFAEGMKDSVLPSWTF